MCSSDLSATIRAMQAHINALTAELTAVKAERAALLDRLLEKRNIAPITEPETPKKAVSEASVQVIAPYGVSSEMQDAVKASWIAEETEYLQVSAGYDYERARNVAEQAWITQNKGVL